MASGETLLNGRYRLIAQQGSGGMAVIYKAIDQALGRTVAVKILRPSLTKDPTFLARFRNEARAVANLSHPNIVTVHDVGSDGQTQYIVMEFVEGQDLKKIIRSEGILTVRRTLDLAIQICAGIGFAHRAGLVHADLKPQNILVTKDDIVKVTDFGIAQALTDTQPMPRQDVVWGSPHYFSPEQARGEKPTPASDVYAIGIVMFEMLTGRLPYTGASQQELAMAHLRDRVPLATEFNPSVPENLSKIIYKVMSKEPSARYRLADQLGHILRSYQDSSRQNASNAQPPTANEPPAPPSSSAARPPGVPVVAPRSPVPPVASPSPSFVSDSSAPPAPPASSSLQGGGSALPPRPADIPAAMYNPASAPAPRPGDSRVFDVPSPQRGDSARFYSQPQYTRGTAAGLDVVTIVLAVLAFMAVFCLIPLYIVVFQVRFGG